MSFHMLPRSSSCRPKGAEDRASCTAAALPREPDPSQPVAAKLSRALLETHGADYERMQLHGA